MNNNHYLYNIIIFLSLLIYISSESNITNNINDTNITNNINDTNNNTSSDIYYNHTSLEDNLYFVVTTYRHGARYPFFNIDFFGNGIRYKGHLTSYGAIQHLEIGKKYKERYSNFLDMNFNPKEMYIRSSDVHRTVISTMKQLEGLFGKEIGKNYFKIVGNGLNYWNLYTLNNTARQELEKYYGFCNSKKRRLPDISEIFPLLQRCYGTRQKPEIWRFCDSVFTAYYEYTYSNRTDNKIGRCGKEYADKMHDYCVKTYDEQRGWDEGAAYMFYTMYQQLFYYMTETLEGKSPLKMVMIGGHDTTLSPFMNFLDGLKIIPRTHYPHYACNIVIELRKYSEEFYLEFYYNDILKYNETLKTFRDILDNSKYSNMYNYCGLPPWLIPKINTTTIDTTEIETTNIEDISTIQNIEEISTTQNVEETTNNIFPEKSIKIEEETFKVKESEIQIEPKNNMTSLVQNQKIPSKHSTLKTQLKKFFEKKSNLKLFIIIISILASVFFIILFVCLFRYLSKKKKKFIKLSEERSKTDKNIYNSGIITIENRKEEKEEKK